MLDFASTRFVPKFNVVVPAPNAVTLPDAETVATAVSLEVQIGLIVALVPSL